MSGMVDSRDQYLEGDPRRPSSLAPDLRAAPRKGDKARAPYQEEGEGGGGETDKYAGLGIGVAGLLAENLACHPFIVLRRQCQVNVASRRAHTTPLTLLPVFVNLYKWQGVAVLWKGVGSSLMIKGLNLGVEDCLGKVTPWPKEIDRHSSLNSLGQHLLLKCASAAIITPFFSASLVETVQSDIASEKPGVLDMFREGIVRLLSWSDPRCGRMLPVWVLVPPQVVHATSHYIISTIVQGLWLQVLKATHREYQRLRGAVSKDPQLSNLPGLSQYQDQVAAMAGHLTADFLLFPLETVLHRLHLQGTRSIIDNLDTGREVLPILTRYEGVADCFSTILQEEGFSGLFKGVGAMMLQYGVHFLIIKFSSKVISELVQLVSSPRLPFPDPGAQLLPAAPSQGLHTTPSQGPHLAPSQSPHVLPEEAATRSPRSVRKEATEQPSLPVRGQVLETGPPQEPLLASPRSSGLPTLLSFANSPPSPHHRLLATDLEPPGSPGRRLLPDLDLVTRPRWSSLDTL